MRKIAVITGTRADYGIYKSVLHSIKAISELDLSLLVIGMHLSSEFGYTLKEIEKDNYKIYAKINVLHSKDSREDMAKNIGVLIAELSEQLALLNPDILLILGDRGEMLAGAISATYLGIPIAHIHGGDISGNVDDPVRHAITKLAHIHLPATPESAQRILKMGEEPWRIHVVGAPGLDLIRAAVANPHEIIKKYKIDLSKSLILVAQHPVVSEIEFAGSQIIETLDAIKELALPTIWIYPNADAGGRKMIDAIKKYQNYSFIQTFQSIPHEDYFGLMNLASVLVGNSSSGIIEAPSFNLPVINIGTRQLGRQREKNVIDVDYNKSEIIEAIKGVLKNTVNKKVSHFPNSLYGDGTAGIKIAQILSRIEIDKHLTIKRMTY